MQTNVYLCNSRYLNYINMLHYQANITLAVLSLGCFFEGREPSRCKVSCIYVIQGTGI